MSAPPIRGWLFSVTVLHRAHWDAARWYGQIHLGLGVGAAICSTIAGTSAMATVPALSPSLTGALGLLAAVLVAVQTTLRAAELSASHKTAGVRYGRLRREIEAHLATAGLDSEDVSWMAAIRFRWGLADDEFPPVPSFVYRRVRMRAEEEEARQRRSTGSPGQDPQSGSSEVSVVR